MEAPLIISAVKTRLAS